MINNAVLVSGVQQSDSVVSIHIHVSILVQILFPCRFLQSVEQSSLCYTVGPCWLSIATSTLRTDDKRSSLESGHHPRLLMEKSHLRFAFCTVRHNLGFMGLHPVSKVCVLLLG